MLLPNFSALKASTERSLQPKELVCPPCPLADTLPVTIPDFSCHLGGVRVHGETEVNKPPRTALEKLFLSGKELDR